MRIIPINVDRGGVARCIKAGYYKMGWTNFTRSLEGKSDGFVATALIEVYESIDEQESAEELRKG